MGEESSKNAMSMAGRENGHPQVGEERHDGKRLLARLMSPEMGAVDGAPVDTIAGEIDALREELDRALAELGRRRRQMLKPAWLVHEHGGFVLVAGLGVAVVGVFFFAYAETRTRRRERLWARFSRLRRALARAIARPERVAQPETTLGRKLFERAVIFAWERTLGGVAKRVTVVTESRRRALPAG